VQVDSSEDECDAHGPEYDAVEEEGDGDAVENENHESSDEEERENDAAENENQESSEAEHSHDDYYEDEPFPVQQSEDTNVAKRAPGRKPANADADTTSWCHDTLVCFLKTVVAHNPFAKHGAAKIANKWQEIANDMARATRLLGVNAVTARPEALRIKFGRLKTQLKNFRESGKSTRQSGLASVRARNAEMSELADIMDECINLQKDIAEQKNLKKTTDKAAKQCMLKVACVVLNSSDE
jgi:hypothetical protein